MKIEQGKFYFIKDEFFELVKDKELCQNKEKGNKKQAVECFDRFLELEPKIILTHSVRRIRNDLK